MPSYPVQIKRLRMLIIARILIGVFFLYYARAVFDVEQIVFYAIIAVICVLSAFYLLWLLSRWNLKLLTGIQIILDLVLESVIVYYTGGVDSLFAPIYVLSILSAGPILYPATGFYVAAGSSLCFLLTVWLLSIGWVPEGIPPPDLKSIVRQDSMYLFYAGYVRVSVFFLVAVLSFYFARMIKHLEGKMKTQERLVLLGEVISNIAHEIRNPLASISGSIEVISRQLNSHLSPKQRKLMGAVVDESERVKRIFSGLLDYSRSRELEMNSVKLGAFLDQVIMLLEHQEGYNRRIKINRAYLDQPTKILVDPEQFKQAVMNVMTNAEQSMPDGGELTVSVRRLHDEVEIAVEDTGEGMDKKTLRSLFIPFKTTKRGGTGLGMAVAYKIVSQHGGRISVDSKKGKGTRVAIAIPRA